MKRKLFRILVQLMAPNNHWKKFFSILLTAGLIFFISTHVVLAATENPSFVDSVLDVLAGIITKLALGVGQVAVLLIGLVTIPLLQYNQFVTSPVVGMGWAIVRDAVNMFYVIVLILIAFGTVLGIDRFKWREQIPRLLGMAIVVNFSRTLCGIMIDLSQIMTLTFVNAIKDIAGGNFVQLFGITSILDANTASQLFDASGATPPGSFDIFIAAIVALMMMLIVLITITFLTIVFAYRIVLLWALVTLAPLAWFFKGAQGVVNPGKDPYTTWWSRFKCALTVGPILSFFLWLALAVAGSGNLASTAGFTTSNAPAGEGLEVGSILKAMSMDQMIGFVVGIALIFVGFDAASDACAGSDGNISGLLKKGKDLMQPIAMAPVAGATLAAKYGWKGVRGAQKGLYNQTIGRGMAKTRNAAGSLMGRLGASGLPIGTPLRSFFSNQSAKIKAKETAEAEATIKDKPMSKDALLAYLKSGPSALDVNNRQYSARLKEAMGREDVMEDLTKDPEQLKKIFGQKMGALGRDTAKTRYEDTFGADPAAMKQLEALKKKMPTAFGGVGDINDAEDIKALSDSQLTDPGVRARIINDLTKGKNSGYVFEDKDGNRQEMDMEEAILKGKLTEKVRKAWIKGMPVPAVPAPVSAVPPVTPTPSTTIPATSVPPVSPTTPVGSSSPPPPPPPAPVVPPVAPVTPATPPVASGVPVIPTTAPPIVPSGPTDPAPAPTPTATRVPRLFERLRTPEKIRDRNWGEKDSDDALSILSEEDGTNEEGKEAMREVIKKKIGEMSSSDSGEREEAAKFVGRILQGRHHSVLKERERIVRQLGKIDAGVGYNLNPTLAGAGKIYGFDDIGLEDFKRDAIADPELVTNTFNGLAKKGASSPELEGFVVDNAESLMASLRQKFDAAPSTSVEKERILNQVSGIFQLHKADMFARVKEGERTKIIDHSTLMKAEVDRLKAGEGSGGATTT